MAGALRPAVLLIVLASALFLATAWIDLPAAAIDACFADPVAAACADGAGATAESLLFGLVNLLLAVRIARGSERMLALRIGLAAFFVIERPVTALALAKGDVSLALHLVTAAIEAVVLASTLRVWRLGHSVGRGDLAALSLSQPGGASATGERG